MLGSKASRLCMCFCIFLFIYICGKRSKKRKERVTFAEGRMGGLTNEYRDAFASSYFLSRRHLLVFYPRKNKNNGAEAIRDGSLEKDLFVSAIHFDLIIIPASFLFLLSHLHHPSVRPSIAFFILYPCL